MVHGLYDPQQTHGIRTRRGLHLTELLVGADEHVEVGSPILFRGFLEYLIQRVELVSETDARFPLSSFGFDEEDIIFKELLGDVRKL